MTDTLPVLVLGYLRKEPLLSNLSKLVQLHVSKIYISFDGAKNTTDLERQLEIIACIKKILEPTTVLWKVTHGACNLGVKEGVLTGVNWFFGQVPAGIVLEDDLEFSKDFIDFCNYFVPRIEKYPDIWMVSGSQVLDDYARFSEPILSNYPMIWGWASSADKWWAMSREINDDALLSPFKFGFGRSYFWNRGYERVRDHFLDTWDLPLAKGFQLRHKYCLISPVNLISNVGVDFYSAHTVEANFPLRHQIGNQTIAYTEGLDQLKHSSQYDRELEQKVFGFKAIHALAGFLHYILRRIKP